MEQKLFDSELKVMEQLWREGDLTAGALAKILADETGWNRNTTYTVIKKLEKLFDGSPSLLFSAFMGGQQEPLPPEEVDRLRALVDQLK